MLDFTFYFNSVLIGIGLAMDAFSVSMANGLNEPCMRRSKMLGIAGMFALFQALMPLIGWTCVHTLVEYFSAFEKFIPWIALALLSFIGGKMLIEGIKGDSDEMETSKVGLGALMVQGVATSIDAFAAGAPIALNKGNLILTILYIGVVTFVLSALGVLVGSLFGSHYHKKATFFGGTVLVLLAFKFLFICK